MRAAMIGGGAYAVGKHNANKNAAEQDQEARLEALEQQQQAAAAPPPPPPAPPAAAPAAAAPAAGGDLAGQLTSLKGLLDAGALSQDEFDAAKAKLLQG